MPSDLTIIVVTKRFVIAVDENGHRYRVETPTPATVAKGAVLTFDAFHALGHPETPT